ncbi:MAG: hypothetical protein Kow0025_11500 [Thermodesulfovibrionales bacterium]
MRGPSGGRVQRWAALVAAVLLIWAFAFVVAPALKGIPAVGRVTGYVRESGIDADALYYTEVAETAEAETYLLNAAEYAPEGP